MVNLRVFGEFRYKVSAPENFVNQFVGTFNFASSAEVEERIKEQMIILIYDSLGDMKEGGMGVADIAANLTNIEQTTDELHGLGILDYNINIVVDPGETKTVTFKAKKSGVFPFYCTNFCSALHQEMQGYLLVKG